MTKHRLNFYINAGRFNLLDITHINLVHEARLIGCSSHSLRNYSITAYDNKITTYNFNYKSYRDISNELMTGKIKFAYDTEKRKIRRVDGIWSRIETN